MSERRGRKRDTNHPFIFPHLHPSSSSSFSSPSLSPLYTTSTTYFLLFYTPSFSVALSFPSLLYSFPSLLSFTRNSHSSHFISFFLIPSFSYVLPFSLSVYPFFFSTHALLCFSQHHSSLFFLYHFLSFFALTPITPLSLPPLWPSLIPPLHDYTQPSLTSSYPNRTNRPNQLDPIPPTLHDLMTLTRPDPTRPMHVWQAL